MKFNPKNYKNTNLLELPRLGVNKISGNRSFTSLISGYTDEDKKLDYEDRILDNLISESEAKWPSLVEDLNNKATLEISKLADYTIPKLQQTVERSALETASLEQEITELKIKIQHVETKIDQTDSSNFISKASRIAEINSEIATLEEKLSKLGYKKY